MLSLHGRSLDLIRPASAARRAHSGADVRRRGPAALAALLAESGFGASQLTVLEALGGPRERIRTTRAADFSISATIDALNVVALEVEAAPGARILARAAGLPDELFEHDGQITKREIRAVTLSSLAPRRGELLWDIGAGSGSVAIEWMLADPSLRAVAIEANADRAARIRRNAAAFGVPGLEIVEGAAPAGARGIAARRMRFSSAAGASPDVLDAVAGALRSGGRLVANAVTLETEALLIARHAVLGGELTRIAVSRADPVGEKTGWRPAMPVTQWAWIKP